MGGLASSREGDFGEFTFTDSILSADLSIILHRVKSKINLRNWLFLMHCALKIVCM